MSYGTVHAARGALGVRAPTPVDPSCRPAPTPPAAASTERRGVTVLLLVLLSLTTAFWLAVVAVATGM